MCPGPYKLRSTFSSNAGTEYYHNNAELELDVTPTSKMIQLFVKDEVGTLAKALQIFNVSLI